MEEQDNTVGNDTAPSSQKGNRKVILYVLLTVVVLIIIGVVLANSFSEDAGGSKDRDSSNNILTQREPKTCEEVYAALSDKYHENYDDCLGIIDDTYACENNVTKQNVVLILDSSGSMAAQINGVPKIDIAKRSLLNVLGGLKESLSLSLVIYGHEGNNTPSGKTVSCAGIDTIYPLGPISESGVASALEGLSATGYTPIAASLEHASQLLPIKSDLFENNIIVFTDGIETCDGVPVDVATSLAQSDKQVVTHVVGFDVGDDDSQSLRNISQAGDGEYFSAQNGDEIEEALQDIFSKACASKPGAWSSGLSSSIDNSNSCHFRLNQESLDVHLGGTFDYLGGECSDYVNKKQDAREEQLREKIRANFDQSIDKLKNISPVSHDPFFNDPDEMQ